VTKEIKVFKETLAQLVLLEHKDQKDFPEAKVFL
jgi:hypothetical protein